MQMFLSNPPGDKQRRFNLRRVWLLKKDKQTKKADFETADINDINYPTTIQINSLRK